MYLNSRFTSAHRTVEAVIFWAHVGDSCPHVELVRPGAYGGDGAKVPGGYPLVPGGVPACVVDQCRADIDAQDLGSVPGAAPLDLDRRLRPGRGGRGRVS